MDIPDLLRYEQNSSVLMNSTDNTLGLYKYFNWYFLIMNFIFMPPTVFGNILIILALLRFKTLRNVRAYILVGNLAVSDLLVGIVCMPMDITLLLSPVADSSKTFCLWYFCLLFTFIGLSVVNLFLLSLERFHAITNPMKHKLRFTKRRIYVMIISTWVLIVSVGFVPLFGLNEELEAEFECKKNSIFIPRYINVIKTIIILSLSINAVFFFIIVRITIKAVNHKGMRNSQQHEKRLKKEVRHTRNMLIVTGLFVIFWGPFCIFSLIPLESPTLLLVKEFLASFGLLNSCLNWIVYGVRCDKFRTAFRSIINCRCTQPEFKLPSTSS